MNSPAILLHANYGTISAQWAWHIARMLSTTIFYRPTSMYPHARSGKQKFKMLIGDNKILLYYNTSPPKVTYLLLPNWMHGN